MTVGFEPGTFRPLGLGQRPLRSRGLRGASAGSCGRFPAARAGARRSGPELELGLEAFIITGRTRSRRVQSGARAPLPRCRPGLCLRRCASARRWLPVQLVADAAGRRAWGWATSKGTRSGSSSSSSPWKSEMRFTGEPDEIQPRPSASEARASLPFQDTKNRKRRPAKGHLRGRHRIRRNFRASPRAPSALLY